jgi:hypothetical protein
MKARTRLRLTIAIGIVLSLPAIRTYLDGGIAIDSAAIRVGVAMGFAALAVTALNAMLRAYTPSSANAGGAAIEDADLVDDAAENVSEEPPL